jgi:hypothetical protein
VLNVSYAATRYDAGYAYGALLSAPSRANYEALMQSVVGNNTQEQQLLEAFLSWQFDSFLARFLPQAYLDELRGIDDGAAKAGDPTVGQLIRHGITLANLATGSPEKDIIYVLINEVRRPPPTT